jgi:hypothetical protein
MKAGFGLRLEVFFLVFGIEGDYRFARARATLNFNETKKNLLGDSANCQCSDVIWGVIAGSIRCCPV